MELKGAKALVTGGSEGIGRGIAEALVGKGAEVVITGRHADALEAAAREIGAGWIAGDVGVEADAVRTVAEFVERHGRIDVLVNNAGFGRFAELVDMTLEDLEAVYRTNVFGAFLMARDGCSFRATICVRAPERRPDHHRRCGVWGHWQLRRA